MNFHQIIAVLEKHYGRPQPPVNRDPFGLIIWENIGYLVDDDRRKVAFEELERTTGLKPTTILATPLAELTRIGKLGGIHEGLRAQRLKEIAHIALNEFDGDLSSVLKLPRVKAIKALKQFPSIVIPGQRRSFYSPERIQSWRWSPTACEFFCVWALVKKRRVTARVTSQSKRRWRTKLVTIVTL